MKISITESNRTAIETALSAINGKASTHCYTSYNEIAVIAARAEKQCSSLLPAKKDFSGAVLKSSSGNTMPNCYKGQRNNTEITIERGSKNWFLTQVGRGNLWPNQHGGDCLCLTPAQDVKALDLFKTKYSVIK